MSSTSVLAKFDPLAVHPFTNTSGLLPQPAPPSQYPHPHPSPAVSNVSSQAATPTPGLLHAPQPKLASPTPKRANSARTPIFVPFRPERSSPDLDEILLKKRVADALSNKQTWSIDQTPVHISVPSHVSRR